MSLPSFTRFMSGVLVLVLFTSARADPLPATGNIAVQPSLIVTDPDLLTAFSLERVLTQIAGQSGDPAATALRIFEAMFDTQNMAADGKDYPFHCDDEVTADGRWGLNGFPWQCPRNEGSEATINPFKQGPRYFPAALVNRFDLAPKDGATCGEYRIVYGTWSEPILIIFEAVLPNPSPHLGLEGCRPVAQFWADLSGPSSATSPTLEDFYFEGLPGFPPVVHVDHYGMGLSSSRARPSGQVRLNQVASRPWAFRELKLVHDCRCLPCQLVVTPVPVQENPYGELFRGDPTEPLDPVFRAALIANVPSLAIQDINLFHWGAIPASLGAPESEVEFGIPSDYVSRFDDNPRKAGNLRSEIRAELTRIGSPLQPIHIVRRAQALSCAGCHFLSNGEDIGLPHGQRWPFTEFNHVEIQPTGGASLSHSLTEVFLPYRLKILSTFLSNPPAVGLAAAGASDRPLPQTLSLLCPQEEASPMTRTRALPAATIEALKVPLTAPIGGRRVH